jgi:DNA modification methylase
LEINKIYNDDCLNNLKNMEDKCVDIIFTDPPYNANKKYDGYEDNLKDEEYFSWMTEIIKQCKRVSKKGIIFYVGGNLTKKYFDLIPDANLIIVLKRAAGVCKKNLAMQYHSIFTTVIPVKRTRNLWEDVRLPGEGYFFKEKRYDNPGLTSQKLVEKVLDSFTNNGDLILDPFMGTGTTAIACKLMGRNYLGFEQSQKYCDIAESRILEN